MNINDLKQAVAVFLDTLGYTLYDLTYKKKSGKNVLTIYIDKDRQITMDDCVLVTEKINPWIDELDPISAEYFLEVSSPGAEKELRNTEQIKAAVGRYIFVKTDEQEILGELETFENNLLTIKTKNKTVPIDMKDVRLIRLAIKF